MPRPALGSWTTTCALVLVLPAGILTETLDPREELGTWGPVTSTPQGVVHSALLPSGDVLFWGRDRVSFTWSPTTNTFSPLIYSATNVFCGGSAIDPSGKILVAGGTRSQTPSGTYGLETVEAFDDHNDTWTRVADMNSGPRWYATVVTLANGETAAFTGTDGPFLNTRVEIYNATFNTWRDAGQLSVQPYARGILLENGSVYFTSPEHITRNWNPETATTTFGPKRVGPIRTGGVSILLSTNPDRILVAGGSNGTNGAIASSAEIYESGVWSATDSMDHPRRWLNPVLLPTGEAIVVGGESDSTPLPIEAFDGTSWRPLARANLTFPYHSTALLLSDGSVVATSEKGIALQRYYPSYFQQQRPVILESPTKLTYGDAFAVETDVTVTRANLVRLSSVTHGLNTDQRIVELGIVRADGLIEAPIERAGAPPGPYLLFVHTVSGIPSEGRVVFLG